MNKSRSQFEIVFVIYIIMNYKEKYYPFSDRKSSLYKSDVENVEKFISIKIKQFVLFIFEEIKSRQLWYTPGGRLIKIAFFF